MASLVISTFIRFVNVWYFVYIHAMMDDVTKLYANVYTESLWVHWHKQLETIYSAPTWL